MDRRQELLQQIKDAKRTGDLDYARELEEELETLDDEEHEAADMDENPENDEEAIEQLYKLDPGVQAELEAPMVLSSDIGTRTLAGLRAVLIADTASLVKKTERVLKALVGNHYYNLGDHTFGLNADLSVEEFARLMRANRTSGQNIKHGLDRVVEYRTPLGYLSVRIDQRGFIDAISVL